MCVPQRRTRLRKVRQPLAYKILTGLSLIALTGCVGAPVIQSTPSQCSELLPASWRTPVAGADLPEGNTVGDWIAFGDAQTGKLDVANGRTLDTIGIIERCEERDAKAVKASRSKFLGIF